MIEPSSIWLLLYFRLALIRGQITVKL